jgi:thiol-disulfide isomerase/thioredoxin
MILLLAASCVREDAVGSQQNQDSFVSALAQKSINTSEDAVPGSLALLLDEKTADALGANQSVAALAEACEQADSSSNVFESFAQLMDKYLFDPNSPLRNEDYYQAYAAKMSESSFLSAAARDKYSYISRMSLRNAVGTKAADFAFSDKAGRIRRLYDIRSEYVLLFFSNPGCESCLEIINMLREDQKINSAIASGRLAVLNIYIDEDIKAWRDYMPVYPETWYNGFDPEIVIRNENIYNVRAIPSLYLLDNQKTVLMKDAVPEKLLNLLNNI